jgi:hypothetical protein
LCEGHRLVEAQLWGLQINRALGTFLNGCSFSRSCTYGNDSVSSMGPVPVLASLVFRLPNASPLAYHSLSSAESPRGSWHQGPTSKPDLPCSFGRVHILLLTRTRLCPNPWFQNRGLAFMSSWVSRAPKSQEFSMSP